MVRKRLPYIQLRKANKCPCQATRGAGDTYAVINHAGEADAKKEGQRQRHPSDYSQKQIQFDYRFHLLLNITVLLVLPLVGAVAAVYQRIQVRLGDGVYDNRKAENGKHQIQYRIVLRVHPIIPIGG